MLKHIVWGWLLKIYIGMANELFYVYMACFIFGWSVKTLTIITLSAVSVVSAALS